MTTLGKWFTYKKKIKNLGKQFWRYREEREHYCRCVSDEKYEDFRTRRTSLVRRPHGCVLEGKVLGMVQFSSFMKYMVRDSRRIVFGMMCGVMRLP